MNDSRVYGEAALLGVAAGMRSLSSPALVSGSAYFGLLPLANRELELLSHPAALLTLSTLAAGEAIADKLPFVPARIAAGPLVARAISGGMSGAAIASAREKPVLFGALVGACAAIGSAYGSYHLRRSAGKSSGIPDPLLALVEDAIVVAGGWLFVRSLRNVDRD